MLDYKREYERWLASDALNADEKAELQAIAGDEKEIESRFYGPLEFGTAGLRGTMKVGLHQMNVHVIRWATQGFADVIAAEGDDAIPFNTLSPGEPRFSPMYTCTPPSPASASERQTNCTLLSPPVSANVFSW